MNSGLSCASRVTTQDVGEVIHNSLAEESSPIQDKRNIYGASEAYIANTGTPEMSPARQAEDCPPQEFDFSELESPDFKEDSVREEIVKPLLNALGYSLAAKNRIHRSKKLKHPLRKGRLGQKGDHCVPGLPAKR